MERIQAIRRLVNMKQNVWCGEKLIIQSLMKYETIKVLSALSLTCSSGTLQSVDAKASESIIWINGLSDFKINADVNYCLPSTTHSSRNPGKLRDESVTKWTYTRFVEEWMGPGISDPHRLDINSVFGAALSGPSFNCEHKYITNLVLQ